MKVNVIKAKDEYAKSCGSLDWHDHINGMSARDVELEMEYVFEYATTEMLDMLKKFTDKDLFDYEQGEPSESYFQCMNEAIKLIKQATEL